MKGELFLVYINYIGEDYLENNLYEFIFSDQTENVDGDDWDRYPASHHPTPPKHTCIKNVGRLETNLKMDLIQQSDSFSVWDAIDGVVAIGWENLNDYDVYPEKRLVFKFGESKTSVESKLYERDMILTYNNKNKFSENEK